MRYRVFYASLTLAVVLLAVWTLSSSAHADGSIVAVSAGDSHVCYLYDDGSLECEGGNEYGQLNVPSGSYSAVAVGDDFTCALTDDSEIRCWGRNESQQIDAPSGRFTQIGAGASHSCAIRESGAGVCWGSGIDWGFLDVPAGTYHSIDAGHLYSCGVTTAGALSCWGWDRVGELQTPSGTFTSVSAATAHACALRTDGRIACWGDNAFGQASPPSGRFTEVSAGESHTCALTANGAASCWGAGEHEPPQTRFDQISAGSDWSCGVVTTGGAICWGGTEPADDPPATGSPDDVVSFENPAIVGWIVARLEADGRVQFGFRTFDGELLLPQRRYFPSVRPSWPLAAEQRTSETTGAESARDCGRAVGSSSASSPTTNGFCPKRATSPPTPVWAAGCAAARSSSRRRCRQGIPRPEPDASRPQWQHRETPRAAGLARRSSGRA